MAGYCLNHSEDEHWHSNQNSNTLTVSSVLLCLFVILCCVGSKCMLLPPNYLMFSFPIPQMYTPIKPYPFKTLLFGGC